MNDEDYIFLDYDQELDKFKIRKGYSYKLSGSLKWDGEEDIYTLFEFREKYPEYIDKTEQLIAEIQSELAEYKNNPF
ncbi:MAG: hypothetical protein AB2552_05915 [Candidatus Thiodiazotropha endolucinida]